VAGATLNPVDGLASQLVRDVGTTWGIATVTIPFASILNGPVVNGVTFVIVAATTPFSVSFVTI
jgi:hypothetical protein